MKNLIMMIMEKNMKKKKRNRKKGNDMNDYDMQCAIGRMIALLEGQGRKTKTPFLRKAQMELDTSMSKARLVLDLTIEQGYVREERGYNPNRWGVSPIYLVRTSLKFEQPKPEPQPRPTRFRRVRAPGVLVKELSSILSSPFSQPLSFVRCRLSLRTTDSGLPTRAF